MTTIEIRIDDEGHTRVYVGGQALPRVTDYVVCPEEADGERSILPAFVGYVVRHLPGEGLWEMDVTLRCVRGEFRSGGSDKPLSVGDVAFPSAVGYAVKCAYESIVEVTITLVADRYFCDLIAPQGALLG